MPRRYLALVVAAVGVLAVGMYLFHEVRATPAPPDPVVTHVTPHDELPSADAAVVEPVVVIPDRRRPDDAGRAVVEPGTIPSLPGSEPTGSDQRANPKLDAMMDEANKAYDRSDFDEAKERAAKVLQQHPGNVRMLRILVSASCVENDGSEAQKAEAQKAYLELPKPDRDAMKVRCARYGMTFNEQ